MSKGLQRPPNGLHNDGETISSKNLGQDEKEVGSVIYNIGQSS